jgi:hypothetical protein
VSPYALLRLIVGVAPPLDATGAVAPTLVTVPEPVAVNVPAVKLNPVPTVTLENPPEPFPYRIDVPDVAGA